MTWFSRVVPALRRALPRVSYAIEMDLALQLKEKLESGALDIAIIANRLRDDQLICESLGSTTMRWFVAKSLAVNADGERLGTKELLQTLPLWCVPRPSGFYTPAYEDLRSSGANLDNICTCNRLSGLIDLVEAGAGIGHLPDIMVAEHVRTGKLVAVDEALAPTTLEFTIAMHRNQTQGVVQHVVQTVTEMGKRMGLNA